MAGAAMRSRASLALLAAAATVASRQLCFLALPGGPSAVAKPGAMSAPTAATPRVAEQSVTSAFWPLVGAGCLLAAATARPRQAGSSTAQPVALAGSSRAAEQDDVALTAMRGTARGKAGVGGGKYNIAASFQDLWKKLPKTEDVKGGGRRGRLGVYGRVCMLTGKTSIKGFTRSFSEKRNYREWHANLQWKPIWWEREKKFVNLYVSMKALKMCDKVGLEAMANRAGLDLYAWSRPHWHPGSRQPLPLKIGVTSQCRNPVIKKLWKKYTPYLNQDMALSDRFSAVDHPSAQARKLQSHELNIINNKGARPWMGKPLQYPKRLKVSEAGN